MKTPIRRAEILLTVVVFVVLLFELISNSLRIEQPRWLLGTFYVVLFLAIVLILFPYMRQKLVFENQENDTVIRAYKKLLRELGVNDEIVFCGRAVTAVVKLVPEICGALANGAKIKVFVLDPDSAKKDATIFNRLEPDLVKEIIRPIQQKLNHRDFKELGSNTLTEVKQLLNECIAQEVVTLPRC